MIGQSVGPYRVLGQLGAGGMGEVYLAEDTRLGRKVALKSPSSSWLREPDARLRLQREARAAARLNSPRIAAVYDVLDLDGRPYIVMEYVEGETLASHLRRGALPVERALALGIELADALATAHAAGVIHRDLKPGNLVLTADRSLKVLDFGLAKTTALPRSDDPANLTHPGQLLGTPGYVAPEQLLGRPADERSDIYSAGAILYEMLTGRAPFSQTDSMGRALASLMEPAPPITSVTPGLPREVSEIVSRAMAREPSDRFANALELREALSRAAVSLGNTPTHLLGSSANGLGYSRHHWWQVALAVVVLLAVAGVPFAYWWKSKGTGAPAGGRPPVVAVLPFDSLSGDSELQGFGAGIADTVSTSLASLASVSVIGRSEIADAMRRNRDLPKVARALGASSLVTGAVQRAGIRLQVTVNVLSPDARIVSGGIYEDDQSNLFALQRRIAEAVSSRLVGALTSGDRAQLARMPTQSIAAITAYWRGRELLEGPDLPAADAAIAAFRTATSADPSFGLAHAGLGSAYWRKYELTRAPEWARLAVESTEKARQLDPEQPAVRFALARIYRGSGRRDDAIAQLQAVLASQPLSEDAHRLLGEIHGEAGRIDDAVAEFQAALRIRPGFWLTYRAMGLQLLRAGRFTEARAAFDRVIDLQPDLPFGYQLAATVDGTLGNWDAAAKGYEAALHRGGSPATHSSLGTVYYFQGRYKEAAEAYERAIELRPNSAVTHMNLADAYRRLDRAADARREYLRSIELLDGDLAVNPRDGDALSLRAIGEARVGRRAPAREQIDRATALSPENPDVQYQRAVTLGILGDSDEALRALERALALGYSATLARSDDRLDPLRQSKRFDAIVRGRAAQ